MLDIRCGNKIQEPLKYMKKIKKFFHFLRVIPSTHWLDEQIGLVRECGLSGLSFVNVVSPFVTAGKKRGLSEFYIYFFSGFLSDRAAVQVYAGPRQTE